MGVEVKRRKGVVMERWFISYRVTVKGFLDSVPRIRILEGTVVTDVSPANWMREHGVSHTILYAEQISAALASELVHGGAGIPAEYYT